MTLKIKFSSRIQPWWLGGRASASIVKILNLLYYAIYTNANVFNDKKKKDRKPYLWPRFAFSAMFFFETLCRVMA